MEYNERNDITPQSIVKPIDMSLVAVAEGDYVTVPLESDEEVGGPDARAARSGSSANWKSGCARPRGSSSSRKRRSYGIG